MGQPLIDQSQEHCAEKNEHFILPLSKMYDQLIIHWQHVKSRVVEQWIKECCKELSGSAKENALWD
jgi:hypothetical protein